MTRYRIVTRTRSRSTGELMIRSDVAADLPDMATARSQADLIAAAEAAWTASDWVEIHDAGNRLLASRRAGQPWRTIIPVSKPDDG